MWGQFFNYNAQENSNECQRSAFEDDLYQYLFQTNSPNSISLIDSGILSLFLNRSLQPDIPAQSDPVKLC